MKLETVLFTLTMIFSASVIASESNMQIAAMNNEVAKIVKNADEDPDEEIGSTDISEFDNQIGAYSREDGAMMGAYGDGEFSD